MKINIATKSLFTFTQNAFLPGHSTLQDWGSDVSSVQFVPPLSPSISGLLVLV